MIEYKKRMLKYRQKQYRLKAYYWALHFLGMNSSGAKKLSRELSIQAYDLATYNHGL